MLSQPFSLSKIISIQDTSFPQLRCLNSLQRHSHLHTSGKLPQCVKAEYHLESFSPQKSATKPPALLCINSPQRHCHLLTSKETLKSLQHHSHLHTFKETSHVNANRLYSGHFKGAKVPFQMRPFLHIVDKGGIITKYEICHLSIFPQI